MVYEGKMFRRLKKNKNPKEKEISRIVNEYIRMGTPSARADLEKKVADFLKVPSWMLCSSLCLCHPLRSCVGLKTHALER